MEARIIKLELLSAMQDETIKSLSMELFQQQKETGQLRRRVEALEKKVAERSEPDQIAGNERPPHW